MRKVPLLLFGIAMLAFVTAAEAKNRDKSWEFGVMGGLIDNDTIDNPTIDSADNSATVGLRFGYNFSAKLEAEAAIDFANTDEGDSSADFLRGTVAITGNFLTDRETHTIPYLSVGIGVINQKIDAFTDSMGKMVPEAFDASALLTFAVGARTFFTDVIGARYEARYFHHDTFNENQDEFAVAVGVTFVVGGAN
ncbi:MAG: outer membrane beta-barrel protein [Acidobacteriota bacterium]